MKNHSSTPADSSDKPESSALEQLKKRLEEQGTLTGHVASVSYIDGPRRASYTIKAVKPSVISVQVDVNGPYGQETETCKLNPETGAFIEYSTKEPENFGGRIIAVVYHAIGLPSHYWESAAMESFDTRAACLRALDASNK